MDGGARRELECERENARRVRARRPDAAALSVTNVPLFCFMCVVSARRCSFFNCDFSHKFTQSSGADVGSAAGVAVSVGKAERSAWEFSPLWVRRIHLAKQRWEFQLELHVCQRQRYCRILNVAFCVFFDYYFVVFYFIYFNSLKFKGILCFIYEKGALARKLKWCYELNIKKSSLRQTNRITLLSTLFSFSIFC